MMILYSRLACIVNQISAKKSQSDLDVELEDNLEDRGYLENIIKEIFNLFKSGKF